MVSDLVSHPCGWPPSAPSKLRQNFLGECVSWDHYSTSRYLGGEDPTLLYNSEILQSSPCPDLVVELLPDCIAGQWESMRLMFAAKHALKETIFVETLIDALALIRRNPIIHGSVAGMCRSLHVLVCHDREVDVSFSDPELPFSVFVSYPSEGTQYRVERLAESIIHEALHLQLTLVDKVEPLVLGNDDDALIYSPWKEEKRNLKGLVHGVYVFGNLREYWTDIVDRKSESARFGRARVSAIETELSNLTHLVNSRNLTTLGRRLVSSFLAPHLPHAIG